MELPCKVSVSGKAFSYATAWEVDSTLAMWNADRSETVVRVDGLPHLIGSTRN
jgi:hypothetical protein